MSNWDEAPGQTQDTLERLYPSASLGCLSIPLEGLEGVAGKLLFCLIKLLLPRLGLEWKAGPKVTVSSVKYHGVYLGSIKRECKWNWQCKMYLLTILLFRAATKQAIRDTEAILHALSVH